MENWKDIPGYEGYYQASDLGRIRSLDRVQIINNQWGQLMERNWPGKVLSQTVCKSNNYYSVELYIEKSSKRHYVHRLIALVFVENPDNKTQVNHINGDKLDNRAVNLEYCTRSENMMHALDTGLSTARGGTHYSAIKVIDTKTGKTYDTIKQAAMDIGLSNSYLKNMLCGRQKNKTTLKRLYHETV